MQFRRNEMQTRTHHELDVDLTRVEIPDGDGSIRSARFRDGKSGRAAATDLLPDR